MRWKAPLEVCVVILFLLIFIGVSCIETSFTAAQNRAGITLKLGGLSLKEHKMTTAELDSYKNSVGIYKEGENYNKIVAGYDTGLSPPTADGWIDIAKNAYIVESITPSYPPPSAIDQTTSPYFPPIGDQGQQGSCASFATAYYCKTYQEAKEHQWNLTGATWTNDSISEGYQDKVMSPAFVYNLINGGVDEGSDFETPIRLICNVGICSWANKPYNDSDYTSWPSEAAWNQAPHYRSDSTFSYQYLRVDTTLGILSLKNWLAEGNLAVIAVDAYDNLWNFTTHSIALNSQDTLTVSNYLNGDLDHAGTIVGYNDSYSYMENGTVHYGAFKIANSWGKGLWENIPDGCYWISYALMQTLTSRPDDPVVIYTDLTAYQPSVLASFKIAHAARGDLNIIFGLGTPNTPIVTKSFTEYVSGGTGPFPENNIVLDVTEFKDYSSHLYNQPFFMQIYDADTSNGGTSDTGTITLFAIGNTSSPQTPLQTISNCWVNLTLKASLTSPTFTVSPTSGPAGGTITLSGNGFTSNTVDISYLNPVNQTWLPLANNLSISENFTYTCKAPDLLQNNSSGDKPAASNNIIFRAQDNSNFYNTSIPYTEWRRGLTQICSQTASGLFGNNTNLATSVFVQNNQYVIVAGKWFSPGKAAMFWDNSGSLGNVTVDDTGTFNATVVVPVTSAGNHSITINDGTSFCINVTRLPTVVDNYTNGWRTSNFTINLTPDFPVTEIYYKINNATTCTVNAYGQPVISTEGSNVTLEYWSTWNVYGTGNMELPHVILTGIKLDKTEPQATMQINGGALTTGSNGVTVTLTAYDAVSGVSQMRLCNDGAWSNVPWQPYASSINWQLSNGDGAKTVYCQIKDNAGFTASLTGSIMVNTEQSTPAPTRTTASTTTASPSPTPQTSPTPQVPELTIQLMILTLLVLATAIAATKCIGKKC